MRRPVAVIGATGTMLSDYVATKISTPLFLTVNGLNYLGDVGKRAWGHYTDKDTYKVHKARFKVRWGFGY